MALNCLENSTGVILTEFDSLAFLHFRGPVVQLAEAPDSKSVKSRFKSGQAHHSRKVDRAAMCRFAKPRLRITANVRSTRTPSAIIATPKAN